MRKSLQQRGSDLLVRFGRPGKVIPALIQALEQQGDTVTSVWMQKEVTAEETASENNIASALGSRFHLVHTKPLVHVEDLPFKIEKLPDVYTPFRKAVEGLREKMWRRELPMPDRFKPFPDVPDNGAYQLAGQELELDTLLNHLLKPLRDDPSAKCDEVLNTGRGDTTAYPLLGGETSALKRIDFYFFEGRKPPAATYKTTRNNMIGHEYSTKFSSALAVGSLSPRRIMTALEEHDRRFGSSKDSYWIQVASLFCSLFCSNGKAHLAQFELLWRDFCVLSPAAPVRQLTAYQSTISPPSMAITSST